MRFTVRINSRLIQRPGKIGLAALCLTITGLFAGCERKKPSAASDVSEQMCTCFRAHTAGDIDAHLTPCADSLINARRAEIAQLQGQPGSVALPAFFGQVTQ